MKITSQFIKVSFGSIFLLAIFGLSMSIGKVEAWDCIVDTNGDGIGDGAGNANSASLIDRLACGGNAAASGASSMAVGYLSSAAANATAVGNQSSAAADNDTALGYLSAASGSSSTAVGQNAKATGSSSTAMGKDAQATGAASTVIGEAAIASETNATALGQKALANQPTSTAVGVGSKAKSSGASVLGYFATVDSITSFRGIAIGTYSYIGANSPGAIAIGTDSNDSGVLGTRVVGEKAIAIGQEAEATAPGAIAIGADVIADIPNTLITNVPIFAKDPDMTVTPRTMFEISGAGNTKFTVSNSDAMEQWSFANPGTGFRLSRQGSGVVEFEVKNNGNAVLAGTLTENSDVNNKQDIKTLDQQSILDKVMELDIAEWRYKDDPQSRHIGPMAQDFYQAFELGDTDKGISTLDSSGVALAAIQALKLENTNLKAEKDNEIANLKQLNQELMDRLDRLEGQFNRMNF